MNRRSFRSLLIVPLALASMGLAAPASVSAASPQVVAVSCQSELIDAGFTDAFVAGRTFHIQDWVGTYRSVGSALCTGTTIVFPSKVKVSNGLGGVEGRDQYVLSEIDGGWLGSYVQTWGTDVNSYGREVARGYGALEGWELRTELVEYFDGTIMETGFAFAPGS